MKVKPYRVCDICGEEYHKTHNCMKVKILIDPMRYTETYGDLPIMSKLDICPKCAEDLMSELMLKVADRKTEPQTGREGEYNLSIGRWATKAEDEPQTEHGFSAKAMCSTKLFEDEPQIDCPKNCPAIDICTKDDTDCPWK